MIIIAFLGVVLLAASLCGVFAAFRAPQFRRSENLAQIDAYGYAARNVPVVAASRQVRKALDAAAAALGAIVAKRVQSVREDDVQRELISAGDFTIGARKF